MSFFSRWFGPRAKPQARRPAPRRAKLFVEALEKREVPANTLFKVEGASTAQVALTFEYNHRLTAFWDEIGVYTVDDDQGRVDGLLPADPGYAAAALDNARMVFEAGEIVGTKVDQTFSGGTRLGFYIIRNNTLTNWERLNPNNILGREPEAFFSLQLANNDDKDHVRPERFADRSLRLNWENGTNTGDRDFNDDQITISYRDQEAIPTTGQFGQLIPISFTFTGPGSTFRGEVGIFSVNDATGTIGGFSPGDEEWPTAALTSATRKVLFTTGAVSGAVKTVFLQGNRFFGMYLIQNGTAQTFLANNPANTRFGSLFANFSFKAANVEGKDQFKVSANNFGFETSQDPADRQFNDFTGSIRYGTPANTAPFRRTQNGVTGIPDISVNQSVTTRTIDLAGHFDDRDFTNSVIQVNTNLGPFQVMLFDRATPRTVANIFTYIKSGKFNSSIFHRSAKTATNTPFVIQGGGFKFIPGPPANIIEIGNSSTPTVQNEFDRTRSNVRGTIAMAKKEGDPNSATSEFFFNLGNNASNLDNQNGGFTVFGTVLGDGMKIVDRLAAIPTQNRSSFNSAFGNLPLRNFTGSNFPVGTTPANYAFIQSIQVLKRTEFLSYQVISNSNTALVTSAVIENHRLKLTFAPGATGTADIKVRARDSKGNFVEDTFRVTRT